MAEPRFEETGEDSFCGTLMYDRVVPQRHFLRQLRALIPWERFTQMLLEYYRGEGRQGRPPYNPVLILRMLLIAYLYNLSERQTEQAEEKGIEFGEFQVVDSVHTAANVNTAKDDERRREGNPPRDPDARWGVKGDRLVRTVEGETKKAPEHFYGYKAHMSLNTATELITGVVVTAGNVPDGKVFGRLLEKDLSQGLPVKIVGGDRAYDDTHNHILLWSRGIHSALLLKEMRTKKKDKNKEVWIALKATAEYQRGKRERYKIERKFGEAKTWHGLRRCRHVGRIVYAIQAYLTVIVLNLKRLLRLLTGVSLRAVARAGA